MAVVHEYKRLENNLVQKVKNAVSTLARATAAFFRVLSQALTKRYTIVLVPHSGKKVYNIHITVFSLICFLLILTGAFGTFYLYGSSNNNTTTRSSPAASDTRLRDTQASLDMIRDEVALLLREVQRFEPALSSTISLLGTDIGGISNTGSASAGDLTSFLGINEIPEGSIKEVEDLRRLQEYLAAATVPIREIGVALDSQSTLLTEIPSIWPVRGGIGHISAFFGQMPNPFTGQYYIHRGIDISTRRQGDPVVATADGQVVLVDYDRGGFGNNIVIRHRHGFSTRYAHLLSFRVRIGDRVQQGDIIGYIGNTGLTTGPHIHYEVHIGSDVVDPYRYLSIRSSTARSSSR